MTPEQARAIVSAFLAGQAKNIGRQVTVQALDLQFHTGRLTSIGMQQDPPGIIAYLAGREPMLICSIARADTLDPARPPRADRLPSDVLPPTSPREITP